MAVLVVVEAAFLLFVTRTESNIELWLLLIIMTIVFGASTVDAYVTSRPTELVVRLDAAGIEGVAGEYSLNIPWSSVERLWVVRSGPECPVLCVAASDPFRFRPRGPRWRLKTYANRHLFGTPLATPLVNTGLSEPGLLDAAREYLERDGAGSGRPTALGGASPVDDGQPSPTHHRFRRRLAAGLAALVIAVAGVVWLSAVAGLQTTGSAAGGLDTLWTVIVLVVAVVATLMLPIAGTRLYHAIVLFGDEAGRFREPVLRVGPDGVEHVVRGKSARLPWPAVQRVYPAGNGSRSRFVCVTTADPLALVPRVRDWSARAKQNERRYGAPVAVSLAGSGLTEEDLLNAVRHYSGKRVTVG
ncbi:MAG: hypothetical protein GEV03_12695 [Streptosporangiales bacterium]|nr:hypothetical protein [Streptosporangiales bacterium]